MTPLDRAVALVPIANLPYQRPEFDLDEIERVRLVAQRLTPETSASKEPERSRAATPGLQGGDSPEQRPS